MNASSRIDPELVLAYNTTEYRIDGQHGFILRIGEASAALCKAHQHHKVQCSGLITACNPFSGRCDVATNQIRQRALALELKHRSLAFDSAMGQHPANRWPGEVSLLAYGLSLCQAMALGQQFQQNALVWSATDGIPQLILLR